MAADTGHGDDGFTSLKAGSTDSRAIESYYDDWAGDYDATLASWDYQAPREASQVLVQYLTPGAPVLDVGCGTGLFARAMTAHLDVRIDGLDISQASLDIAREQGHYARLLRHDLQNTPLPVDADVYDAAACVGVLTYIADGRALLADICRAVRAGGHILFTQRDDRWTELDFESVVRGLEDDGLWRVLDISAPRPYLPGNDEFGDDIRVVHVHCQVS